jgi:hypothetical protein
VQVGRLEQFEVINSPPIAGSRTKSSKLGQIPCREVLKVRTEKQIAAIMPAEKSNKFLSNKNKRNAVARFKNSKDK